MLPDLEQYGRKTLQVDLDSITYLVPVITLCLDSWRQLLASLLLPGVRVSRATDLSECHGFRNCTVGAVHPNVGCFSCQAGYPEIPPCSLHSASE